MGMRLPWIALVPLLSGCFVPHWETWRPDYTGTVVDSDGRPQASVRVVSCSVSKWSGLMAPCEGPGEATTGGDGGFHFARVREMNFIIFGEAPLPFTVAVACAEGGRVAVERVTEGRAVRLVLAAAPSSTAPGSDLAYAVTRCRP